MAPPLSPASLTPGNSRRVAAADSSRPFGRWSSGATPALRLRPSRSYSFRPARIAVRERFDHRYVPMMKGRRTQDEGAMMAQARRSRICSRVVAIMPVLECPQAAVDRALVIERQAAPEVGPIHERDAEAAKGGVVGRKQPVYAAADDQHVVRVTAQGVERGRSEVAAHPQGAL